MEMKTDVVIVGSGVSGLYCALNLPDNLQITIVTKSDVKSSDSFLAQGGICVLKEESDYESYFEDTMRAGHYENRRESVDTMIRSSKDVIEDLIGYGVCFEKEENGTFKYTREGAHSTPRILFHQDITGKEITGKLLAKVEQMPNVTILEHTAMIDLLEYEDGCHGILCVKSKDEMAGAIFSDDLTADREDALVQLEILADYTVLASGGLGGIYRHSTNFRHLTGDALAICLRHGVKLKDLDYIQIHPTTLYSTKPGRRFLISESVRGEGAVLYNAEGNRFCNELLPRDIVTGEVKKQMQADNREYVMLSMEHIPKEDILGHFPNIYKQCLEEGYDVTREPVPVVPAQHYFMGGIDVDSYSRTSMEKLYAVGETSCNGVHGANRLASNSLLESLVFAGIAAKNITNRIQKREKICEESAEMPRKTILYKKKEVRKKEKTEEVCDVRKVTDLTAYRELEATYKKLIEAEIERMRKNRE